MSIERINAIKVPALVVVGEQDNSTLPKFSEDLPRRIAGSKLVTIPEAGHMSTLSRPEL